jgi:hypothetical protein
MKTLLRAIYRTSRKKCVKRQSRAKSLRASRRAAVTSRSSSRVACRAAHRDATDRQHMFVEKAPIVTSEDLLPTSSYVAAAAFPCDLGCRPQTPSLSQVIHNVSGLVGYALAPVFLFLLGLAARSWPNARWLTHLSFAFALIATAGLLTISPTSPMVGLSQRVLELSVLGWVLACSLFLARRRAA